MPSFYPESVTMINPMKSRFSALLTLALISPCVTSPAHAEDNEHERPHSIRVSGMGRVSIAPDKADLTLSVETQAKSAEAARNQAAAAMKALLKAVKAADVAEKDIQTRYVSLYPVYAPDTGNKISGYRLANQVTVIVRDIGKISTVIDNAVTAGGNSVRVQGISFAIDNPEPALLQAREKAYSNAKAKAGQYAGLAGVKLGRAMHISEGGGTPPMPVPYAEMSMMKLGAGGAEPTPVQVGEQEVSVTVDVVFGVE